MSRFIIVYGVIAGVTVAVLMRVAMMMFPQGGTGGVIAGFASMIIALTFVFVGVKRYRDVELGGVIRFNKALAAGFGIAAVATMFYVAAWELYLYFSDYKFMEEYIRITLEQAQKAGKSAAEVDAIGTQMDRYRALYANPLSRMAITAMEILPVALLMPIISAALLRNSRFMPARI